MTNHQTQVKRAGQGVIGTCSCRARQLDPVPTRQAAEDWIERHLRQVALARAGRVATPSLPKLRDQYLENAEQRGRSPAERAQWRQLAAEISRRLGDDSKWEQSALFSPGDRLEPDVVADALRDLDGGDVEPQSG